MPYFPPSGLANPMSAGGDMIIGGASGVPARLANGSAGQYVKSTGSTNAQIWSSYISPTVQIFLSGSGTYNLNYAFTVASATANLGDTYTNNGVTFTVWASISGGTLLYARGSGPPTSSGNLVRSGGGGTDPIVFSEVKAPLYLKVEMVAGGSGGNSSAAVGALGGNTTFGSSLLSTTGGAAPASVGVGGIGGSGSITAPAVGIIIPGAHGQGSTTGTANMVGGTGGGTAFGGGGGGGCGVSGGGTAGSAAPTNSGAGGGGNGGASAVNGSGAGAGGGAIKALIPAPLSATYAYAVGGGGGGGSGTAGAGAAGFVIIEEHYQ